MQGAKSTFSHLSIHPHVSPSISPHSTRARGRERAKVIISRSGGKSPMLYLLCRSADTDWRRPSFIPSFRLGKVDKPRCSLARSLARSSFLVRSPSLISEIKHRKLGQVQRASKSGSLRFGSVRSIWGTRATVGLNQF